MLHRCWAHTPDDRPYIERFFGSIAANLSSRLPGYTGTSARDVRRALSDPKRNLRLYVSLDEIEELLQAAIAQYNASAHVHAEQLEGLGLDRRGASGNKRSWLAE